MPEQLQIVGVGVRVGVGVCVGVGPPGVGVLVGVGVRVAVGEVGGQVGQGTAQQLPEEQSYSPAQHDPNPQEEQGQFRPTKSAGAQLPPIELQGMGVGVRVGVGAEVGVGVAVGLDGGEPSQPQHLI
ncbi:MAG: hypothetical protein FJ014_11930 [Chloroflexi bacterium]|nr:hypothetical protein [Chloroflexota bacterium]